MHKPGRIQKKYDIMSENRSQELFSTSPDSPVHVGAAAIKPIPVVRTNPMYEHMEGVWINDTIKVQISSFFVLFKISYLYKRGVETKTDLKNGLTNPTGEQQYHPTAEKLRIKKTRHRHSGSFGSMNITPRNSPSGDRKVIETL